jgi:hypothetical protein
LKVVLLEAHDFAKGTSSRSTKLVHGGVRYLAQGHLPLVWEALRERQHLLSNAAHLVQPMPFVMPAYRRRDQWLYGLGLKLYDLLAGPARLGPTRLLGHADTLLALPGVRVTNLVGGVEYWDAQFDDARLALALARTAASHGALMLNHMPVTGLLTEYPSGRLKGLTCQLTWGYVTAASGTFTVYENGLARTITLTPGNYSFKGLAAAITSSFFAFDASTVDYNRFRCTYSAVTNKLTFASPVGNALSLAFPTAAAAGIYGFSMALPGVLTSTKLLDPMPYNSLCVTLAGIRPRKTFNLANLYNEGVGRTNLMAVIPIDASTQPYSVIQWRKVDDGFAL